MAKIEKNQLRILIIALFLILLSVNAYLLYDKSNRDSIIEKQQTDLDYMDSVKAELDLEYNAALEQLEAQKGNNEELNAVIENQKEELKKQKMQIERMIRQGKQTRGELDAARVKIQELIAQRDTYLGEIETLKSENAALSEENNALSTAKEELESNLTAAKAKEENLTQAKTELEKQKEKLAEKVSKGSILNTRNIVVTPLNIRNSGRETDTRRARKTEKLNICFNVDKNTVVESGTNKLLVRILTPLGEPIYLEKQGSGQFANQSEGGQITRFTTSVSFDYDNAETKECVNWLVETPLQKGEYTVELYNKGYKVGTGKFELN